MNVTIANKLVNLRKSFGLSQEDLAEKLGISRQAISKWECAESAPDMDNLMALAKLYDISVDELLNEEVEINPRELIGVKENELSKKNLNPWIAIGIVVAIIAFILVAAIVMVPGLLG